MNAARKCYTIVTSSLLLFASTAFGTPSEPIPGGELRVVSPGGEQIGSCPLKHTDVEAEIAGFVSHVRVRQTFQNPLKEKVEAVYVFPLPHDAAVNDMVMTVGDRRVVGQIQPREQARAIYEMARAAGHVAGLLDQERPNIFTQSVANIEPGARVVIEIGYVETLQYEDGEFAFVFPMVVGPRYIPGTPIGKQGAGWAPDTTQVPDASRITPPVAPPGTRAGHDISLTVRIDAGMELLDVKSELHDVDVERTGADQATVTLQNKAEIPNKDFILRYRTATDAIEDAFLVHADDRGTFFTLIIQPPRRVPAERALPKEMIFVIDRSGSMSGFPIEKAKETMRGAIEKMNPSDTFNLLSFSGGTGRCFDKPVPNTAGNRAVAFRYLDDLYGSGGTEMLPAIQAALGGPADPTHLRVVCFMTDGYIGNDKEIIDAVKTHAGTARVFAFGIGNAVNRFLLDGMAHAGRGEVEYVTRETQAEEAAERFRHRIQSPVLANIQIDWGSLPVSEVYPRQYPDLFSSKPIMIHGQLNGAPQGAITLRGETAAGRFERRIAVTALGDTTRHDALASLWARAKVKDLTMADYVDAAPGSLPAAIREQVTALGVQFRLLTEFTSFVAVEETTVTIGGETLTVAVPVELPEGVSYEGVFGTAQDAAAPGNVARAGAMAAQMAVPSARGLSAARGTLSALMAEKSAGPQEAAGAAQDKLAEPLRGLAERVAKEGKNGDLTGATLHVATHRVDVILYLRDTSAATLDALKKLGFVQMGASKAASVLIGTIDVRKLEDLAKLAAVVHVAPLLRSVASR